MRTADTKEILMIIGNMVISTTKMGQTIILNQAVVQDGPQREYDRMSRVRSNDVSTTSHTRHRSVSVTQDKFSDRSDPQSAYSDVDPATSMIDEASTGQREIYHDGAHHRRKHDRHY